MAFYLLMVSFGAIIIVGTMVGLFTDKQPSDPVQKSSVETLRAILAVIAIPAFFFGVGYLLNRLRDRYFPAGVFDIGQGVARNARNEKVRVYILGSLIAPSVLALLSYLGSWLYRTFNS